jgi:hypothetical protein
MCGVVGKCPSQLLQNLVGWGISCFRHHPCVACLQNAPASFLSVLVGWLTCRGGKTGMPAPFRPTPFKPAKKRSGVGRANLGVRVQNSSPPVYWRGCGLAGMPAKIIFFIFFTI